MARLKWNKPARPGEQVSKCGRYRVERNCDSDITNYGCPAVWYAHFEGGSDDTMISFSAFLTRAEAKECCEKHNQKPWTN